MHSSRPSSLLGSQPQPPCFRLCGVRLGFGSFLLGTLLFAAVMMQSLNLWSHHSSLNDEHHIHVWAAFGISSQRDPSIDTASISESITSAALSSNGQKVDLKRQPTSLGSNRKTGQSHLSGTQQEQYNTAPSQGEQASHSESQKSTEETPQTKAHASSDPSSDPNAPASQLSQAELIHFKASKTQSIHSHSTARPGQHDGGIATGSATASSRRNSNTAAGSQSDSQLASQSQSGSQSRSRPASGNTGAGNILHGAKINSSLGSNRDSTRKDGNKVAVKGSGSSGPGSWAFNSTLATDHSRNSTVKSYWSAELAALLEVPDPFYVPFDPTPYKHITKMPRRPLWWFGGFVSKTGYGEEARNYMLSLLQSGVGIPELLWASQHGEYPHDISEFMDPWEQQQVTFMTSWRENNKMSPYIDKVIMPHAIVVCHSLPFYWNGDNPKPAWPPPKDVACPGNNPHAFTIGRTMTETHDITHPFAAQCNLMDEVWVPSEFHKEQFARGGVHAHKLRVVPEGVNTTFYNPDLYEPMALPRGEIILGSPHPATVPRSNITVFMSVFKFENRKGWDVLVESYLTEFNSSDPVELYLLTRKFGEHQPDIKWQVFWFFDHHVKRKIPNFKQHSDLPPIYLVSEYIPSHDLPRFYKAASVVVQPTRGEGWGRPQAEGMAMAVPVISTNWSGVTAFLDDTVGYPLPIDGIYPTWDSSASYFENQTWAGPSISRLKKLMRYVMNHKEEREAKGRAARQRMLERFSPNMIARIVAAELQRIHKRLAPIPTAVKVLCQDADRLEDVNCTTENLYRPLRGKNDTFWSDTYGYSTRQEFMGVGLTNIVWAVNASKPHPPGLNTTGTFSNPHTAGAPRNAKQKNALAKQQPRTKTGASSLRGKGIQALQVGPMDVIP